MGIRFQHSQKVENPALNHVKKVVLKSAEDLLTSSDMVFYGPCLIPFCSSNVDFCICLCPGLKNVSHSIYNPSCHLRKKKNLQEIRFLPLKVTKINKKKKKKKKIFFFFFFFFFLIG